MLDNILLIPIFFFLLLFSLLFILLIRKKVSEDELLQVFLVNLVVIVIYSFLKIVSAYGIDLPLFLFNKSSFSVFILFFLILLQIIFIKRYFFASKFKTIFFAYVFCYLFSSVYISQEKVFSQIFFEQNRNVQLTTLLLLLIPIISMFLRFVFELSRHKKIYWQKLLLFISILLSMVISSFTVIYRENIFFNIIDFNFIILSLNIFIFALILYLDKKHNYINSIKEKMLILVSLLIFVPLTFRSVYIYSSITGLLLDNSIENLAAKNDSMVVELENALDSFSNDVVIFTKTVDQLSVNDKSSNRRFIENFFIEYMHEHSSIQQVRYLDINGKELIRVNQEYGVQTVVPEYELQDKSDRDYFIESQDLSFEEVYVSDISLNREGFDQEIEHPLNPVLRFISPIFVGTKKVGSIILNISFDKLLKEVVNAEEGEEEYATYIIDENGYFILHPDKSKMWAGPKDLQTGISASSEMIDLWSTILSGKTSFFLSKNNLEYEKMYVFSSIDIDNSILKEKNVYVVFEQDLNIFLSDIFELTNFIIFSSILISFVLLIITNLVLNNLNKPLLKLTYAVKNYSKIELESLHIDSSDEVEQLANLFAVLAKEVQSSQEKITYKVSEQTKEISENADRLEKQRKAMVNLIEDIDQERKITEGHLDELKKFKLAIDSVSELIVITDLSGKIIYANPAVLPITGYSQKEVIGTKVGKLWGGLMSKEWYQEFWEVVAHKKMKFIGKITNIRKDGEKFIANITAQPIMDKSGNVEYYVSVQRDITRETQVDRMKTDFISLASHQLRTPLSGIRWFLEMLHDEDMGTLNSRQIEAIDNISKSTQRMISLVNALLNISRIESGRIIISPTDSNFTDLVEQTISSVKNKFVEKNQNVEFKSEGNIPILKIDIDLITQVVLNLLTNAIKYTPENGQIKVYIYIENQFVVFRISDNGYGIPVDEQKSVFQRFFRARNSVKIETDGTGLGLYLAKTIIISSGGDIWFESKENQGTTFWFTIPIIGMKPHTGEVKLTVSE